MASLHCEVESAGELELDLRSIVEWGERWLVTFNATKMKLLSFNGHRGPLLLPAEMNGSELPEETSFRLLGMNLTLVYTVNCHGCFKESGFPLYGPRVTLLQNPSCICTNLPFGHEVLFPYMGWFSKVPCARSARSSAETGSQLLGSGLSSDLQALALTLTLSHRRDVASLSLLYKYYYVKFSSELAHLLPVRVTVRSTRFS